MADSSSEESRNGLTIVITGGAGFLGHALVGELLGRADRGVLSVREIRIFDREPADFQDERVTSTIGDIGAVDALNGICDGADLVFHAAALVDWGNHPEAVVRSVNVTGTENVVRACCACDVPALVLTSTLDVVFDGRPIIDGDESLPYPAKPATAYCRTKAEAERIVVAADGRALSGGGALHTAVVRPLSMYGERDPYHVPGLLSTAGPWPIMRIGNGRARCQHVYVGNVAHAHLLAARSLRSPERRAAGQIYFVSDSAPQNFFDFLEPIARALGYRMVPWALSLPRPVMLAAAAASKWTAALVRPVWRFTPLITRFAVDFVCLDFTFSSDKIRRELGYEPVHSEAEAMDRTIAWFRSHPAV